LNRGIFLVAHMPCFTFQVQGAGLPIRADATRLFKHEPSTLNMHGASGLAFLDVSVVARSILCGIAVSPCCNCRAAAMALFMGFEDGVPRDRKLRTTFDIASMRRRVRQFKWAVLPVVAFAVGRDKAIAS